MLSWRSEPSVLDILPWRSLMIGDRIMGPTITDNCILLCLRPSFALSTSKCFLFFNGVYSDQKSLFIPPTHFSWPAKSYLKLACFFVFFFLQKFWGKTGKIGLFMGQIGKIHVIRGKIGRKSYKGLVT